MTSTIERVRRIPDNFRDYFFPKNCLNCHAEGHWLCESCADSLFLIDSRFCPFCGRVGDLFDVCQKCRTRAGIIKVFSLFRYGDSLAQKLVKSLKYRYLKDIAQELTPVMRKFIFKYKNLLDADGAVLVPVPLHWYKECARGFNQAEELAKIAGEILGLPVLNNLVSKKWTKNQAELERGERFSNLKNCFIVRSPAPKNIIIVDDVFTTGSTVRELALALKSKGAENIQVITLARG